MLATDAQAPEVTQTTVGADLFESLQILTQLGVQVVGRHLGELAVADVLLSIEEPVGDLELARVRDDGDQALHLLLGQLSGALVQVDVGLLADDVGEAAADTLDGGEGEHHLAVSVDVRVHHTENVLESFGNNERHRGSSGCVVDTRRGKQRKDCKSGNPAWRVASQGSVVEDVRWWPPSPTPPLLPSLLPKCQRPGTKTIWTKCLGRETASNASNGGSIWVSGFT